MARIPPVWVVCASAQMASLCFNASMRHWGSQAHRICAVIALALLPACSGGGGEEPVGPILPSDPVLAQSVIGPAGGVLTVIDGADAGLRLEVPAGAVAVATEFRLLRDLNNGEVPSIFPVYRFEPESLDLGASPVTVTVPIGEQLLGGGGANLTMFQRNDASSPWLASDDVTVDLAAGTLSLSVARLGEFLAWEGNLHRLLTQDFEIFDPAVPVAAEFLYGTQVVIANGTIQRTFGSGSLASFWNSSAADNVLIVHGVFGSPLDFLGPEDLVANLSLIKRNVVLLSYPSARGVAYAANELYDLIAANKRPGFGCTIVGHSIGGLIGRYLLEKSADDPSRRGFGENQDALQGVVDQLILLGTPNGGAQALTLPFAAIEAGVPEDERWLLQVGQDLSEEPDSLPLQLNASYVDNATRYHLIYGDIGIGSDGVVSVASVLALPLFGSETEKMFGATHPGLHRDATTLGIAVWIGTLLQQP
jgi:pimeloyl-ACP methyl ester carboxylesterase